MSLARAARRYAELGWAVFPLLPRAKTPLTKRGFHDATTDAAQIDAWWAEHPDANIGIACGAVSGLVVVDVDGPDGEESLAQLPPLDVPPVEQTTGRGRHLLFRHPGTSVRNSAGKLGPKLDVRGDGGYIVVAPSVHPDGHKYQWLADANPVARALPELPPAWLHAMQSPAQPTPAQEAEAIAGDRIGEGGRNDTLTRIAGRLFARGLSLGEVEACVIGINATRCHPPLEEREVRAVVASVAQSESRNHGSRVEAPLEAPTFLALDQAFFDTLLAQYEGPIDTIETPWRLWNKLSRGFGGGTGIAAGWHVVIAGPSNSGKSLLALNLAIHGVRQGKHVVYVSLEMSAQQLAARALAIYSGEPAHSFEPGDTFRRAIYERTVARLTREPGRLEIVNRPDNRLAAVLQTLDAAAQRGAAMIVIDYLQLIGVPKVDGISDRMFAVSQGVQRFAYRTGVRTIALSQLNRATSFGARKESPVVEGLQGSSALENDADQVLLIDNSNQQKEERGRYNQLLLAKNRHGPQGSWRVWWDRQSLQVNDAMRLEEENAA